MSISSKERQRIDLSSGGYPCRSFAPNRCNDLGRAMSPFHNEFATVGPARSGVPAPTDAVEIDAGENPLKSGGNRLKEIPQAICRASEYGWGRFLGDISGGVIA